MKKILQRTAFVFAYTLSLGLMFFATPAAVQAQDAENLIINGDFATGNLDGWTPFVADWEGVQAAFGVIDGEAAITNHTGPRNVVWHVQLNQILTQAQINALEVGQSYKVTFDARSPEAGRQLRMFFGEEGGGFAMVTEKNIALTTSMETYEAEFTLGGKFPMMKLGFEMGLSAGDVFIDNVTMVATEGNGGAPAVLALPIDFNNPDLNYRLADFGGNVSEIVTDPTDSNNRVVRSVKGAEGVPSEGWAGTTVGAGGLAEDIPFSPGNTTMSVRVWSPAADIPVRLKVELAGTPEISVETEVRTTVAEEWETLVFDFANQAPGTAGINFASRYNMISIFFNFNTPGTGQIYFWDDVQFGGEGSGTPGAPGTPVGFVAQNAPAAVTMNAGDIFLASGPNNAGTNGIVYRLFYALASDNVQDPTTSAQATEHEFGSIAGDNGGTGAFGFILPGLQAGAEYTFWLYQYDSVNSIFSQPAIATERSATGSGGNGGNGSDPGPANPPMPLGFVAERTLGETPLNTGELFLAVGPNNVGNAIIYRLFYAKSSDNVTNPIEDATEYQFGTIGGDGNGVGPFGFVLPGLDPGVEYTFWLFQFNTDSQLFSEPGVVTAVAAGQSTSIEDGSMVPVAYALSQNFPNPFNPTTQIRFELPESGHVQLEVFNMMGQRVATLVNESRSVGVHTVTFDASSLSSGMYIYRLQAGSTVLMQKMTLLK